jgi:toxin CcdB
MAQFDIYRNPSGKQLFPLVLDVQAEILSALATRVVVPMAPLKRFGSKPIRRLNPTLRIGRVEYLLVFQELAAIPASELGERVGTLASRRSELMDAIDLLFTGI